MQAANNEDTVITTGQKLSVSVTGTVKGHERYTRTKDEVDFFQLNGLKSDLATEWEDGRPGRRSCSAILCQVPLDTRVGILSRHLDRGLESGMET